MKASTKEQLREWARKAVEVLNEVSASTRTQYYLQSPLSNITAPVNTVVIGINPGSAQRGVSTLSAEEFLAGNSCWPDRFESNQEGATISIEWAKYFGGAHLFICGDESRHVSGFDDDTITVWTNLTPFATCNEKLLNDLHFQHSVPRIIELLDILKPKQIVLLSMEAFDRLEDFSNAEVQRQKIVRDTISGRILEIGAINAIPAIQLPHPSGNWGFHGLVIPVFFKMWQLYRQQTRTLEECAVRMRTQLCRLTPP